MDEARAVAATSLAALDKELEEYSSWRPIFLARRAEMLAVLGRFDEATDALAEIRRGALCEGCDFCSCKDADLSVCRVVALRGDLDQAEAMARENAKRWPGEEEFGHLLATIRTLRKR